MKTYLIPLILLISWFPVRSQMVSKFTWDSNPVTQAAVGPNAISVNPSATSASGGVGGTNGLRPVGGDLNLVIPGSVFDIPSIDISLDFRREENVASFFTRGTGFDFGMNGGNLYVKFRLVSGAGYTTINSGNVYSIPNDHNFHNYRFSYNSTTGIAGIWVDGSQVYTYTNTPGISLYWTGAGDAVVGQNMDGTNRNITVLDNLIVSNPSAPASLPLRLESFTARISGNAAILDWSTTREYNVAGFDLERSVNGVDYSKFGYGAAQAGYNSVNRYHFADSVPPARVVYYRLKMVDIDGKYTYSPVRVVTFGVNGASISFFPNPAVDFVNIRIGEAAEYQITLVALDGKILKSGKVHIGAANNIETIRLDDLKPKGVIFLQLVNKGTGEKHVFKILRS